MSKGTRRRQRTFASPDTRMDMAANASCAMVLLPTSRQIGTTSAGSTRSSLSSSHAV